MTSPRTIEKARRIERHFGKSYYLATVFLPKRSREAVFILYAFVRIPDEMVDNPTPGSDPSERIHTWKAEWEHAYHTGESKNDILLATREVFLSHNIPFSLSLEFLDAMMMDLSKTRYRDDYELATYTRGSAEVIGLILTHIFGYQSEDAFPYATLLGRAMQRTNFLRDINEDYVERGRIYLPETLRRTHGVTEDMIAHQAATPEFIALMKAEIATIRGLYREAGKGIALLSPEARRAVTLASRFYEAILDAIEYQRYDVFARRARVSFIRKLAIIVYTYAGR